MRNYSQLDFSENYFPPTIETDKTQKIMPKLLQHFNKR
jgi:hypothetical protein